ncbi:hypothetical protein ACFPT7_02130 [Acidicapsa dinghuensis]|uniref:Uncharacterized protein n=1 Tax=Acidicapsa dinghuensis TaxID=2218256 RepID=A0ABW1EAX2_9BACT|nr:hypothetical protein [Acidicapsa dinghuensis]
MNQEEKRQLENELMVMGLPGLDDPALVQAMADLVNGYPYPAERADFFCEMLNECEGPRRREMYEAMRPRLSFPVPSLDACEARIAARAERMIRPRGMPGKRPADAPIEEVIAVHTCGRCGKGEEHAGQTIADAMGNAKKAGWGRGTEAGTLWCAECRLAMMPAKIFGNSFTSNAAARRVN